MLYLYIEVFFSQEEETEINWDDDDDIDAIPGKNKKNTGKLALYVDHYISDVYYMPIIRPVNQEETISKYTVKGLDRY